MIFFHTLEEDQETKTIVQEETPPLSPIYEASLSSNGSSSDKPRKMRSIEELYDVLTKLFNLFCLTVDGEPLDFDEALKDKTWI